MELVPARQAVKEQGVQRRTKGEQEGKKSEEGEDEHEEPSL